MISAGLSNNADDALPYDSFASIFPYLPTPEQREVIEAQDASLLVVAGAGSGKTATMSQRIVWHIASGHVSPDQVLGLTFTRKAAGELASRVRSTLRLVGKSLQHKGGINTSVSYDDAADRHAPFDRPTISTYNSFAAEIAASYGLLVGSDPRATLITGAQRWQIMDGIVRAWRPRGSENTADISSDPLVRSSPQTIIKASLALADRMIANGTSLSELRAYTQRDIDALTALDHAKKSSNPFTRKPYRGSEVSRGFSELLKGMTTACMRLSLLDIVEAYLTFKQEHSLVEFADQVAIASRVLNEVPDIAQELRDRYTLIVLDEYQDTSSSQAQFLAQAFAPSEGDRISVCAVGDPNQAIYGWRGAGANALSDFARDFHVAPEAHYSLSTAFRNSKHILAVANALTAHDFQTDPHSVVAENCKGELSVLDRPWLSSTWRAHGSESIALSELVSDKKATQGRAVHIHRVLADDTYEAIAIHIAQEFAEHRAEYERHVELIARSGGDIPIYIAPSAAVLVRKHTYATPLIAALKKHNVAFEHIGGESVISAPEIMAARGLLGAAFLPNRGDLLLYVLNFYGIGAHDIRALSRIQRDIDSEQQGHVSLVDALDALLDAHAEVDPTARIDVYGMSQEAYKRLIHIGQMVRALRQRSSSTLPEIVRYAISALDLHSYAAARIVGSAQAARRLARFLHIASEYMQIDGDTSATGTQSVTSFLEWLEAADEHEQGADSDASNDADLFIDTSDIAPEAGVVQILTVHAAKGLEWDIVAVPAMVEGEFDAVLSGKSKSWMVDLSALPVPLRADRSHLPGFSVSEILANHGFEITDEVLGELGSRYFVYLNAELTDYETQEMKRLAYVALTRPRRTLILATYDYSSEDTMARIYGKILAKHPDITSSSCEGCEKQWEPPAVHRFVDSVREALSVQILNNDKENTAPLSTPAAFLQWVENRGLKPRKATGALERAEEYAQAVRTTGTSPHSAVSWPRDVDRSLDHLSVTEIESFASRVKSLNVHELAEQWRHNVDLVLADTRRALPTAVEFSHLTASDLVSMMQDADTFIRDKQRPMPQPPSKYSRRGTRVHERIARFFDSPQTLDIDAESLGDSRSFDDDWMIDDARVEELLARFYKSRFSSYRHIEIEHAVDVTIADVPIRCVIDAVFDTSGIEGAAPITIVDWKTGRRPSLQHIHARQAQLAIYRIAWAQARGVPIDQIDAYFYYLGEDDPACRELRASTMNAEDITQMITGIRSPKFA